MIINLSKKTLLARCPLVALGLLARGRGMIGRDFSDFDAMVFHNCNSVHTMFMRINIDLLFIDLDNAICGLRADLPPWRLLLRDPHAVTVIELPAGAAAKARAEVGDKIDLNAELTQAEKGKLLTAAGVVIAADSLLPIKGGGR